MGIPTHERRGIQHQRTNILLITLVVSFSMVSPASALRCPSSLVSHISPRRCHCSGVPNCPLGCTPRYHRPYPCPYPQRVHTRRCGYGSACGYRFSYPWVYPRRVYLQVRTDSGHIGLRLGSHTNANTNVFSAFMFAFVGERVWVEDHDGDGTSSRRVEHGEPEGE